MAIGAVLPAWGDARRIPWPRLGAWSLALACTLGSLVGCAGGAPLLHPAQPLPVDTVSVGAGVSGEFASAEINDTIEEGRSAAGQPLNDPATANAYAQGVLTEALVAPGMAPWVAARVGLPSNTEAGLTYTGRSLRLDGRFAFDVAEQWMMSVGLGVSGVLLTPDREGTQVDDGGPNTNPDAEFELTGKGWGADLPVLIGYQVLDGIADVWLGPRFGFESLDGDLRVRRGDPTSPLLDAEGTSLWASFLAGFSLGIPPLWLRFELATTYHRLSGSVQATEPDSDLQFDKLEAAGWTLMPSGAIVGKF